MPASASPAGLPPGEASVLERALRRVLDGEVRHVRQISGGASRVTSAFDLVAADGTSRPLVIQQDRGKGIAGPGRVRGEVALLRAAGAAGVPAPGVVTFGDDEADGLGHGWLVVERMEGETIPRKILRDAEWAHARAVLTTQCARALAAIHALDLEHTEGLAALTDHDPLSDPLSLLDSFGDTRPAIEFGARWLTRNRPPQARQVPVHGDFRLGNLMIGSDGLRAVLDWELAHIGDAAEDLAWLSAPAWRFGGPGQVGGFGDVDELLDAYVAAGGELIDPDRFRWWSVYATVKWATICAMQGSAHLRGTTPSVESAAIGRRVCESEWDLFVLLGLAPDPPAHSAPAEGSAPAEESAPDDGSAPAEESAPADGLARSDGSATASPFGRPSAVQLVEAVREYLEHGLPDDSAPGARFMARVARNALLMVERELQLGAVFTEAHHRRLAALGFDDDRSLAAAIRSGACDAEWTTVGHALAASARDQLLVANPSYLPISASPTTT
jgi:aminoglycoside phosphotransferase (APT) family kinase protein